MPKHQSPINPGDPESTFQPPGHIGGVRALSGVSKSGEEERFQWFGGKTARDTVSRVMPECP